MRPVSRVAAGAGAGGQRAARGVAGCEPAVTRSATAWRGSPAVTRPSPTRTASAPAAAYAIRSCGPRTPDSATLTTSEGSPGAIRSKVDAVDLQRGQVAGVDPDHRRAGGQRAVGLGLGVHLDQRGHAERLDPLEQADERVLLERGDDEQDDVGAVRPGLVHLVAGDDEVLAQHRHVDGGAHRVEVGLRAAEAAPLGEHADHPGAAGGVLARPARPGRGSSASAPLRRAAAA